MRFALLIGFAIACFAGLASPAPAVNLHVGAGRTVPGAQRLPCDIAARAGTPCVAAHSVTRRLWRNYYGPLFQITRASDSTTLNVGVTAGNIVNQGAINSFCASTTCAFSLIYDQMHTAASGNNLPQPTPANQAPITYTTFANGKTLPMVGTIPGQYYRNRAATVGIPTGNASITEYMVVNSFTWSNCCGTYGDMENTVHDDGSGTMFTLSFGTTNDAQKGTGTGPWVGLDYENGEAFYGATVSSVLVTGLAKYNSGTTNWSLKSDPGLKGTLGTLLSNGAFPATAAFEGGLSLGEGGDSTAAPTGFHEGVVIAALTSDATDNAIAQNVAAFYGAIGTPSSPTQTPMTYFGESAGGGSPQTFSPSVAVPAGSLILIVGSTISSTPGSDTVTDTQGNTYTEATFISQDNLVASGSITLFYAYDAKPLSTSDVITYTSSAPTYLEAGGMYVTGILSSGNPLDSGSVATAFAGSGTPSVTSGVAATLGEFFVAGAVGGGVTQLPNGWLTAFNAPTAYGAIRVPGTEAITFNPPGGGGAWGSWIVGFKHQ